MVYSSSHTRVEPKNYGAIHADAEKTRGLCKGVREDLIKQLKQIKAIPGQTELREKAELALQEWQYSIYGQHSEDYNEEVIDSLKEVIKESTPSDYSLCIILYYRVGDWLIFWVPSDFVIPYEGFSFEGFKEIGFPYTARMAFECFAQESSIPLLDVSGREKGIRYVGQYGKPQYSPDMQMLTEGDGRSYPSQDRKTGIRSILLYPVYDQIPRKVVGVIGLYSPIPGLFNVKAERQVLFDTLEDCLKKHNAGELISQTVHLIEDNCYGFGAAYEPPRLLLDELKERLIIWVRTPNGRWELLTSDEFSKKLPRRLYRFWKVLITIKNEEADRDVTIEDLLPIWSPEWSEFAKDCAWNKFVEKDPSLPERIRSLEKHLRQVDIKEPVREDLGRFNLEQEVYRAYSEYNAKYRIAKKKRDSINTETSKHEREITQRIAAKKTGKKFEELEKGESTELLDQYEEKGFVRKTGKGRKLHAPKARLVRIGTSSS